MGRKAMVWDGFESGIVIVTIVNAARDKPLKIKNTPVYSFSHTAYSVILNHQRSERLTVRRNVPREGESITRASRAPELLRKYTRY